MAHGFLWVVHVMALAYTSDTVNTAGSQPVKKPPQGGAKVIIYKEGLFVPYINVSIGTPKAEGKEQNIRLNLDTGSSTMWVSTQHYCEHCAFCKDACDVFDPSESTSFVGSDKYFLQVYGDGRRVNGTFATDVFKAGLEGTELVFQNMVFGFATFVCEGLPYGFGTFGLAPCLTSYKEEETPPPFTQLTEQLHIEKKYSVFLNEDGPGELVLGGTGRDKVDGPLVHVKINQDGMTITLDKIQVGGKTVEGTDGIMAVLDTGAPIFRVPQTLHERITKAVFGPTYEGSILFTCSSVQPSTLPDIAFVVKGTPFIIKGEQYIVNVGGDTCAYAFRTHKPNIVIIAAVFLQYHYIEYDLDKIEIGIAKAKYTSDTGYLKELKN